MPMSRRIPYHSFRFPETGLAEFIGERNRNSPGAAIRLSMISRASGLRCTVLGPVLPSSSLTRALSTTHLVKKTISSFLAPREQQKAYHVGLRAPGALDMPVEGTVQPPYLVPGQKP